ncbi:MAG: ATP-binding protein [Actinomycetota bacterium]|nr:ATP-binding protein [Actinomycetota bacterium]
MRTSSLFKRLLGVEKTLIEGVGFEGDDLVVRVRLHKRQQLRCSRCGRRCGLHDGGRGRRRWRAMDLGTVRAWIEGEAPRVLCPTHGAVVSRVTWARPGSGFTRDFEDQVAWLATNTSQSTVGQLMRIAWRTVGRVLRRVVEERGAGVDPLDGLMRIGIDETSYRRGHRYLTERHRIEDAQRRFVADASHEMRTPIAALKGILELLVDGAKDDAEVRDDFIQTMKTEADRLSRLVMDLLTLAKLEAGSLELRLAPEYAVDLIGDVAGVMQTLADQQGVALSVEVANPDMRVSADRDRIVQVLLSFTDNALKHSPSGTTIHLRATPDGSLARFEVIDEGPGIPAEEISRVFERFYRADAARAGGGGTGLGLAIAKEIVEAHGSAIVVDSSAGAGTTFGFDLAAV